MTLQQLKYVTEVADCRSFTEAAKRLFISQPSLSLAVHELETELNINLFRRKSRGVLLTAEGEEFLNYARQVVQEASLIEDRYIKHTAVKKRFAVSTQHYSFTAGAFIELVKELGTESYDLSLREGRTADVISDVRTLRSEIGVIYLSSFNEQVLERQLNESGLVFTELYSAQPHIFIGRRHPLAGRGKVTLRELEPYPCLSYDQGEGSAFYYSEEILSNRETVRSIKVTDKSTIIDLMSATDSYTISSGIAPGFLRGDEIVSIPLDVPEVIRIGAVTQKNSRPTTIGERYMEILRGLIPKD